jgi:hypothetical protein
MKVLGQYIELAASLDEPYLDLALKPRLATHSSQIEVLELAPLISWHNLASRERLKAYLEI